MNIKKVKLKKEVFMERMTSTGVYQTAIDEMMEAFGGKILSTDIDVSFKSTGAEFVTYNVDGWAVMENELEFLEDDEMLEGQSVLNNNIGVNRFVLLSYEQDENGVFPILKEYQTIAQAIEDLGFKDPQGFFIGDKETGASYTVDDFITKFDIY